MKETKKKQSQKQKQSGKTALNWLPTAFRPRTMSGKPDGELASRNAQKNNIICYTVDSIFCHGLSKNNVTYYYSKVCKEINLPSFSR